VFTPCAVRQQINPPAQKQEPGKLSFAPSRTFHNLPHVDSSSVVGDDDSPGAVEVNAAAGIGSDAMCSSPTESSWGLNLSSEILWSGTCPCWTGTATAKATKVAVESQQQRGFMLFFEGVILDNFLLDVSTVM
jgi:hypothetical protein